MPALLPAVVAQTAIAAPAVVAPTLAATGTAAAQTAALELAKQKAIETSMQQMATQGAKQATAEAVKQQVGQQVAKQGIAQAGQQVGVEAAKQGIFSANPAGMPPTAGAPITPTAPATPLPPAGNAPTMPLEQQVAAAKENAARELAARGGNVQGTAAQTADPLGTTYGTYPSQQFNPATGGVDNVMRTTSTPPFNAANAPVANATINTPPADPSLGGFSGNYIGAAESSKGITAKGLDPNMLGQSSNVTQGINVTPDMAAKFGTPAPKSALAEGFETALKFVKENKLETGMGLMAAGQYMNKPEEEDKDKYKNTVDMSGFQASVPTQRPFTRSYEYQGYAMGGPVEQMASQNSVGANTGYPMANLQTSMYSNPMIQRPEATNVIAPSVDTGVGAYTGEPRFAEGGLSAAQRREYGLQTRGQRAARSLTKSYEEMEEERQKEAMKLFGERSDPGIIRRSRTQELSSPFSAAMTEHARLGKKAKVPVVEMPKTNLGDIDNYMDIPIEAAGGGIMHGAEKFSNGGPAFMGTSGAPSRAEIVSSGGPAFMGAVGSGVYGSGSYSEGARLPGNKSPKPHWVTSGSSPDFGSAPYSAPAQQARYTPQPEYVPVSYQNDLPPQQQPDMSDFYANMDQQLASYGYAAGGGIMSDSHLGSYSDGGRLLKGPGDGVSDSIPAVIGRNQPARLADGEFVVPARIVSELGNGSTEAGARKLYAMMERVQAGRKKSIGKKKVAVNSKSDKHLPA